jgi:hypothetical protein
MRAACVAAIAVVAAAVQPAPVYKDPHLGRQLFLLTAVLCAAPMVAVARPFRPLSVRVVAVFYGGLVLCAQPVCLTGRRFLHTHQVIRVMVKPYLP